MSQKKEEQQMFAELQAKRSRRKTREKKIKGLSKINDDNSDANTGTGFTPMNAQINNEYYDMISSDVKHARRNNSILIGETYSDNTFNFESVSNMNQRTGISMQSVYTTQFSNLTDDSMNLSLSKMISNYDQISSSDRTSFNPTNRSSIKLSQHVDQHNLSVCENELNNKHLRVKSKHLMFDPSVISPINNKDKDKYESKGSNDSNKLKSQLNNSDSFTPFEHIHINDIITVDGERVIEDFYKIKHKNDMLIHSRGISPPVCVFQTILPKNIKIDDRMYYRLIIPNIIENQRVNVICCRKKRKKEKYRFSTDELNLQKRGNKNYVGKMKLIEKNKKYITYLVTLKDYNQIATIKIEIKNNVHCIEVKLLDYMDNLYEEKIQNNDHKIMTGIVQTFMQPQLKLLIQSSKRIVLELKSYKDITTILNNNNIYNENLIIDFDYPLSMFLSFAIICALKSRKNYLKNNNLFNF